MNIQNTVMVEPSQLKSLISVIRMKLITCSLVGSRGIGPTRRHVLHKRTNTMALSLWGVQFFILIVIGKCVDFPKAENNNNVSNLLLSMLMSMFVSSFCSAPWLLYFCTSIMTQLLILHLPNAYTCVMHICVIYPVLLLHSTKTFMKKKEWSQSKKPSVSHT